MKAWLSDRETGGGQAIETEELHGILAQDEAFRRVRQICHRDARVLHRRIVERRIATEKQAFCAEFSDAPFNQSGQDAARTRGIDPEIALLRGLHGLHLKIYSTIVAATVPKMSEQHLSPWMAISERNKIYR